MYSSKSYNPKKVDSWLNVGDPYDKDKQTNDRHRNKQFQTNPAKKGQTCGYFSTYNYSPDNYQDTNGYRVTQPRENRQLAFGSQDANKRDEFTLTVRALQWKQVLEHDNKFTKARLESEEKKAAETAHSHLLSTSAYNPMTMNTGISNYHTQPLPAISPRGQGSFASTAPLSNTTGSYGNSNNNLFQTQVPTMLYDIGRPEANGVTPPCNKCSRETFYCKHRVGEARRLGQTRLSSHHYGQVTTPAQKPEYGRRSGIKEFYDVGHVGK